MYKAFLFGLILPAAATAAAQKPQDAVFSLFGYERTQCYRTCPAYSIALRADGRVEYEGKLFVLKKGKLSKQLSESEFRRVVELVRQAHLFTLRDSYADFSDGCGSFGTDEPSTKFTIQAGGRRKDITHYHGCWGGTKRFRQALQTLHRLASEIDKVIGVQDWIGSDEERAKLMSNELRSNP